MGSSRNWEQRVHRFRSTAGGSVSTANSRGDGRQVSLCGQRAGLSGDSGEVPPARAAVRRRARIAVAAAGCALLASAAALGRYGSAIAAASTAPRGAGGGGGVAGGIGPDVIVGAMNSIAKYGTVEGISAYALGTTSCNIGDEIALWCDFPVPGLCTEQDHPVIAQAIYRLKDGRIEMIGMSWLKHGFCALAENLCGLCQPDPFRCDALGVGCADPYDAALNGQQSNLGPRSQVNASTGAFPYPFTAPTAEAIIGRRLQVRFDDLTPGLNPGALYFGEGLYITPDDAAAGNSGNNASYRRILVGALTSGSYTLAFGGPTFQQRPGIWAWRDHGFGVNQPDASVIVENVDISQDGRFVVAYKVSPLSGGAWRYDYAVYNMTSDRSAHAWTVPVPQWVNVTNFHHTSIAHHSGEPYSTESWTAVRDSESVTWSTAGFAEEPLANALRFGTMFTFGFDADTAPTLAPATLGLFKPGSAPSPTIAVFAPTPADPPPPSCAGDLDGDGVVDGADLGELLGAWGTEAGDLNGDGITDGADIGLLLGLWGEC
ncbi:MAG TPA: hypothetical protein PKC43_10980 [Phycisphaerales bacterium]|nr:hypothetical protein [Phycisphaerales bacterium]HMP37957.1 hypothetical protein [Phycisphaerales bacterium]